MQELGMGTTGNTTKKNKLPFHMPCRVTVVWKDPRFETKSVTPEYRQLQLLDGGSAHMILETWQANLKAETAEANHTYNFAP
jgi:hypothetical protein